MNKHFLLCLSFLLLFIHPLFAQLEVVGANQTPYTPVNLINDIMAGSGIEVINVTYTGDPVAVGYFNHGSDIIGLEKGLLLTTGRVATTNISFGVDQDGMDQASNDNSGGSTEAHLSQLISGQLNDVAYYTITFRSYNDSIRFRYVFASEEYPEYACTAYNDIFGFFLQGPGYPQPVNIALIPGTNLPVSINNIHPVNPINPSCTPQYVQYYHNNVGSSSQPVYDGFLDPFAAEAVVQPCGIYTMTIAIADVADGSFDSGLFIEANSFYSGSFVEASFGPGDNIIPEPATGLPISLNFSQIPANILPLTVSLEGTAQNGMDYLSIDSVYSITSPDSLLQFTIQPIVDNLPEIQETVLVHITGGNCFARNFELLIADPGTLFSQEDSIPYIGNSITLGGGVTALSDSIWTFSNNTSYPIAPANTPISSPISISGLPALTINYANQIESVCMNITHSWVDDIDAYLIAPNGRFMELTTDNGESSNNYIGTCFSPSATQPITYGLPFAPASAAPFTGTFQPEGSWNDLNKTPVNGTWTLQTIDDSNGVTGTLDNWSITLNGASDAEFQYLWSTGDTTPEVTVMTPGIYSITVSNSVSIFEKQYVVKAPCGFSAQTFSICPNDSVVVNGVVYNSEHPVGNQLFQVSSGCDSLLVVSVDILPETHTNLSATICENGAYPFGNQILTATGTYEQVLSTTHGCDSVVTLQLEVIPVAHTVLSAAICEGESYFFNGENLTSTGTYEQIATSTTTGCDSTTTLQLTVHPAVTSAFTTTICADDTYLFGNVEITAPGIYTQHFVSSAGCDSTVSVTLLHFPLAQQIINGLIEPGGSFEAGGTVFTAPGNYSIVLQTVNGCDSTLIIHLEWVSSTNTSLKPSAVSVLPNPATQKVTLQWAAEAGFTDLAIRSVDQLLVYTQPLLPSNETITLDVVDWQSGLYIIYLNSKEGTVVQKLIKL